MLARSEYFGECGNGQSYSVKFNFRILGGDVGMDSQIQSSLT